MLLDAIWSNIIRCEGESFETVRGLKYTYSVHDDYILINDDKRRRITKTSIKAAMDITNPSPSRIKNEGIWGPSYVFGIITDKRIVKS